MCVKNPKKRTPRTVRSVPLKLKCLSIVVVKNNAGNLIDEIALFSGSFLRYNGQITNQGILKKHSRGHVHGIADGNERVKACFSGAALNVADEGQRNACLFRQLFLRKAKGSSLFTDSLTQSIIIHKSSSYTFIYVIIIHEKTY